MGKGASWRALGLKTVLKISGSSTRCTPTAPVLTRSLSLASINEKSNIKLVDGVNKLPIYIHSNFAASLQQVED